MSKLLNSLNKMQKAAVLHSGSPLAIIAGAGSGKTMTITYKIAYLIKELKVDPKKIMAVTFTNKAANEMKERVIKLVGKKGYDCNISTYHSWCARFLRKEISKIDYPSRFSILDTDDQKRIISRIYKSLEINNRTFPYSNTINYISKNKIKGYSPDEILESASNDTEKIMAKIYSDYEDKIQKYKSLDFEDLLIYTRKILYKFPDVAKKWRDKYQYIIIDEFQDTSVTQYEIIKKISSGENLTIVGDPDQTIYTWRGADDTLINNFKKNFKKSAVVKLEENYRSKKEILEKANMLILNNKNRIPKKLFTSNTENGIVDFHYGRNDSAEARWIVSKIQELVKKRVRLNDIAILYRSQYVSQAIEKVLIEQWVSYVVVGGYKFFQREEIKDTIALLKLLALKDEVSLLRLINKPSRGIGEVAQNRLLKWSEENNVSLSKILFENISKSPLTSAQKSKLAYFVNSINKHELLLKKNSVYKVLDSLLNEVNYLSIWKNNEENTRIENIKKLILNIKEWEEENPDKSLDDYLQEVSLYSQEDGDGTYSEAVKLMTVHASKGLEFNHVFLAGFNESVFPSARAIKEGGDLALEEERRLAYVAITRAKHSIYISTSRGYTLDFTTQKKPSRFIEELDININDYTSEFVAPKNSEDNYKKNVTIIQGDTVEHPKFGKGVVLNISGPLATIKFKRPHGEKTLMKNHKSIVKVK